MLKSFVCLRHTTWRLYSCKKERFRGENENSFWQIFVEALVNSPTFLIQSENSSGTLEFLRRLSRKLTSNKRKFWFSGHVFHKHCVPEAACVLCFHQNLTTLGTKVLWAHKTAKTNKYSIRRGFIVWAYKNIGQAKS